MLWVNLPVVGIIHLQSNTFVMGVKIKATGDSKLNDSPACYKATKFVAGVKIKATGDSKLNDNPACTLGSISADRGMSVGSFSRTAAGNRACMYTGLSCSVKRHLVRTNLEFSSACVRYSRRTLWTIL